MLVSLQQTYREYSIPCRSANSYASNPTVGAVKMGRWKSKQRLQTSAPEDAASDADQLLSFCRNLQQMLGHVGNLRSCQDRYRSRVIEGEVGLSVDFLGGGFQHSSLFRVHFQASDFVTGLSLRAIAVSEARNLEGKRRSTDREGSGAIRS
jgi:hypothetical protein